MRFLPRRRWFQFSLSKWFVLVAILAWAMMEWPWIVYLVDPVPHPLDPADYTPQEWLFLNTRHSYMGWKPAEAHYVLRRLIPRLIYPALTLVGFVGWKAAWAVRRRIRGRTAQT